MLVPRQEALLAQLRQIPFIGSDLPSALTLGRVPTKDQNLAELRDPGETHFLIFGPNGSGKMSRVLAPNLLRLRDRSIFVIDPKGELAAITANVRRAYGEVFIINPFGVLTDRPGYDDLKSSGFNPMLTLNPSDSSFNADASLIAEALIKTENTHQPHFDNSARSLVAALIMHVSYLCKIEGRLPTITTVRDLLGSSNSDLAALARHLKNSPIRGIRNKMAQFQEMTDEIRGIASSARNQTEFIDDDEIAADLNTNIVDFREAKKRPITIYLILPPKHLLRHARWLRLIVSTALNVLMRPRYEGEPRVLFLMDEFPILGHMEIIEATWALVRGYGIQMMPVFQSLAQLNDIYGKRADDFIGMAGAIAHFAPNDPTTAQWIIDRAGLKKILVQSQNLNTTFGGKDTSRSKGRGLVEQWVPRYTPQDLYGKHKPYMFLSLAGQRDVLETYAPNYFDVGVYKTIARDNPYAPTRW